MLIDDEKEGEVKSGPSDKRIIIMKVFEIETDEEDNAKDSLSERSETLVKAGGMPLFPLGRRQWTLRKSTIIN